MTNGDLVVGVIVQIAVVGLLAFLANWSMLLAQCAGMAAYFIAICLRVYLRQREEHELDRDHRLALGAVEYKKWKRDPLAYELHRYGGYNNIENCIRILPPQTQKEWADEQSG